MTTCRVRCGKRFDPVITCRDSQRRYPLSAFASQNEALSGNVRRLPISSEVEALYRIPKRSETFVLPQIKVALFAPYGVANTGKKSLASIKIVDLSDAVLFWVVLKKTGALQASFRSAVPNHDRRNEVWGAWLSKRDAKPCFRASAHLNQELRVPKLRGASENLDALSCFVVEKALWTQNSPPLSIFIV